MKQFIVDRGSALGPLLLMLVGLVVAACNNGNGSGY
jgi:predicted small secreted protein